jgi:hypothetical protein
MQYFFFGYRQSLISDYANETGISGDIDINSIQLGLMLGIFQNIVNTVRKCLQKVRILRLLSGLQT